MTDISRSSRSCVVFAFFILFLSESVVLHAQGKVEAIYPFPALSIKEFQNEKFPGTVSNDRKVLLGSVGSDLWRASTDGPGEFWMVTDRGPNGQIRVDGKNRRTFWVPEFNPTILRVKLEGRSIQVLEAIPIVGRSGKPVTGLPNLREIDETPYDYTARVELPFNVNGLDTEGLVRTSQGEFWLADEYGPSLVRLDKAGQVIKRYIPTGVKLPATDYPVEEALPAIFARGRSIAASKAWRSARIRRRFMRSCRARSTIPIARPAMPLEARG